MAVLLFRAAAAAAGRKGWGAWFRLLLPAVAAVRMRLIAQKTLRGLKRRLPQG